ncbi:MAG: Seryl-tRNA synthetase [Chitinophagaceae bacterium]|nr:Seryl-tRNA synthetase [Chitinophagaceae bacterium]
MKKLTLLFTLVMFTVITGFSQMKADVAGPATTENAAATERAQTLTNRLYEIKDMDKSALSAGEKQELRKEVRSIKKEMKKIGGGIYLSVGAIIIIILLLILLL